MKKLINICAIILLFEPSIVFSKNLETRCDLLQSSVGSAKDALDEYRINNLHRPAGSLSPGNVVEFSNEILEKFEDFKNLQQVIATHKKECLSSLESKLRDPVDIALLFKAAQVLPREEYISFVTASADLAESGAISKQQYKWALWPSSKHLRDLWAEDPVSKPLQQLALRAKTVMAEDASFCAFLDRILSRKLAPTGAPRRTIPPLDDGTKPLDITKSRIQSSLESKTTSPSIAQHSVLWPWIAVCAIFILLLSGICWKLVVRK